VMCPYSCKLQRYNPAIALDKLKPRMLLQNMEKIMPNYRLNILFSEKNLETTYTADERIVIVKHVVGGGAKVAWLNIRPFMKTTVDWTTSFALYASVTELNQGAVINKLTDIRAIERLVYNFRNGYFQAPASDPSIPENTYAAKNSQPDYDYLTFGLAQDVSLNGRAFVNKPINAVCVPHGQAVTMSPIERIDIFMEANFKMSSVITHVSSKSLTVEYGEGETEKFVEYDNTIGQFRPANPENFS